MSAALHSLMRDTPGVSRQPRQRRNVLAYIAVGAAGALAFVVLSSLMIWLHTGVPDWLVNTASYAVLIVPVYLMHYRYSFMSEAAHGQSLPRYMVVQGMALGLTAIFSFAVHEVLMLPTVAASVAVVVLTASVNYAVLRHWAFAPGDADRAVPA